MGSSTDRNGSLSGAGAANMVTQRQNPVVGKGEGVSSFVHVNDAATATVALLTAEPGVYNLVDDDPSPQAIWLPALRSLWALQSRHT